jgi:hypothetical protein
VNPFNAGNCIVIEKSDKIVSGFSNAKIPPHRKTELILKNLLHIGNFE